MIRDIENHKIYLEGGTNGHLMITGKSGSGKTFLCSRLIEERLKSGENVLVIDISGSYTTEERRANGFQYHKMNEWNMEIQKIHYKTLINKPKHLADAISESIISALKIRSEKHKRILREGCRLMLSKERKFCFSALKRYVAELSDTSKDNDRVQSAKELDEKLSDLYGIDKIYLESGNNAIQRGRMDILQLSHMPSVQKVFLSGFFTEFLWNECGRANGGASYDTILIDEFQNFKMEDGRGICAMLRQGRKYGIKLILSSQYINDYGKDELNALFQVDTMFFMKQPEAAARQIVRQYNLEPLKEWKDILCRLQRGQAVLKGRYHLNNCSRILDDIIIVQSKQGFQQMG